MKLYIGGVYQGQEELARAENPGGELYCNFHETIRVAVLTQGQEPRAFARDFCQEHPQAIVIANEVGAGVVPMEASERAFREAVGRALLRSRQNRAPAAYVESGCASNEVDPDPARADAGQSGAPVHRLPHGRAFV